MSKPASPASSTLDYRAAPEDITQLRNEARGASAGCCTCTFRKEGRPFASTGKIQQLAADRRSPNGQQDSRWYGEVFVASDGTAGTVTVFQKHLALNKTGDTRAYPGTIALSDADVATRVARIPAAISRAWNARPYRLRITDARCGERVFVVRFVVEMVTSQPHFTLDFVNVPGMGSLRDASGNEPTDAQGVATWRSYILPPDRGKFNLDDTRSATRRGTVEVLEPHEFGHMIGLKDEYFEASRNRGGASYTFPDGHTETAPTATELMGGMTNRRAEPTRYCLTIAYAAMRVLTENGIAVTDCVIE